MIELLALVALWFVCAPIAYATVFADFQRSFPEFAESQYTRDRNQAMLLALGGPATMIAGLFMGAPWTHGLKWR